MTGPMQQRIETGRRFAGPARAETVMPGSRLDTDKMPGHWLLARLGKRVLRPGGLELTRKMLAGLGIDAADSVVEFAPGLGTTAWMILENNPLTYVGVERDEAARRWVASRLPASGEVSVVVGSAENTGLADASATVVLGEAMLTMNPAAHKQRIAREAFRLLRPGGRYGIHELCLQPDDLDDVSKTEIEQALSRAIRVGARPLTTTEWCALLEDAGFRIETVAHAPMNLLRPVRVIQDEGLLGALRIVKNVLTDARARRRVLTMRAVFERYRRYMRAIAVVAVKPEV